MDEVQLKLDNNGRGAFVIVKDGEQLAKMEVGIKDKNLTVYHTEVAQALKGKGIAAKLLDAMVNYARGYNLKVIPLCSFVTAQFKRHPKEFEDVWSPDQHSTT